MGTIYITSPVDDSVREWLDDLDIEIPCNMVRPITRAELIGVTKIVEGLSISSVEIANDFVYYSVERSTDEWTVLKFDNVGEDDTAEFSFINGHQELIIDICKAIASKAGPLILVPDYSGEPIVICGVT